MLYIFVGNRLILIKNTLLLGPAQVVGLWRRAAHQAHRERRQESHHLELSKEKLNREELQERRKS